MLDESMSDATPSEGTQSEVTETQPVRRRRAAGRPAGPPKTVEVAEAVVPVTKAAGTASVVAQPEAPAEDAAEKPKRRRATRQAAAPAPVEAPAVTAQTVPAFEAAAREAQSPVDEPDVTSDAQAPVAEAPQVSESESPQAAPARSTRARRTRSRKTAEPTTSPASAEEATSAQETTSDEAHQAAALEQSTDAVQGDEPQEAPAPARRRRSRKQAATQEQPAEESGDVDARLAAVTAASAERPRRTRKVAKAVANPFVSRTLPVDENGEVDAQAVLNSLAESIARMDDPAAEGSAPEAELLAQDPEAVEQDEQAADEAAEGEEALPTTDEETTVEGTDSDDDSDQDDEDAAQEEQEGGTRRRRRRRGGRRRRRSADSNGSEDSDSEDDEDEAGSADSDSKDGADDSSDEQDDNNDEQDDQGSSNGRRRRRRRRRRGEDTGGAEDDPSDVVVRVREPRRIRTAAQAADEVTGIDGSTRMEAKKQRRREGRAAGRRRAPILSEAEFLARRESVDRRMVIRQGEEYTQLAVLEDNILVEHYVDRASATSLIGNIYLGRVQNVLPSMEAAFIDIGRGRNAVLYAGEIDWSQYGAAGEQKKVEQVLKSGQTVLVQVSKDPVGAKGARLTGHISLPGRYVVYSPGGHLSGISRKLADSERHRLKEILGDLIDDSSSVIVRTAAEGASEEELVRDVNRLKAQWEIIEKKSKQGSAPQQLYAEPDLTVRIVRDLFTEDFSELVVAGNGGSEDAYEAINGYVSHVAPHLADRLTRWDTQSQGDLFTKHKIDEQIAKALERKVFLPSGGSLVIDRTEAMTVIDVNTGKFTGTGGNLEATVTSNNLEAAEEVVRQLRLRDIGGIIVIDFIDMVLPSNRELLLRRLVECLGRDRTRHQVAEVTSLGLVQMTRKKIGTGLAEAFTEECDHCGGRGYVRHDHPVESQAPADGGDRHHGGGRRGRKH
ncbi:Rne/Rng family ribonuclease [Luteococcus sp. Sow4_B9]|uniref:Rne/Rng family ribonuclease n=1 Tax=Luteococcus sp. Sow4_B9 TaxID=3438792 RepID=UPI003F95B09F